MLLPALLGFAAASFAIAISPGPSWFYVITTTLRQDRKAGLVAVLGNATGIVCHIAAATLGLSALLMYSSIGYGVAKWLGGLYLVYLGVRMMGRRNEIDISVQPTQALPMPTVFREGLLVNLLNPKVALLMLALLPQFIRPSAGPIALQTLAIGSLHVVIASLVLTTLVQIVSRGAVMFTLRPALRRLTRYVSGGILVGFGLAIALGGRA
jgi:threonine/homoserine/homoserine lactone efflux protein